MFKLIARIARIAFVIVSLLLGGCTATAQQQEPSIALATAADFEQYPVLSEIQRNVCALVAVDKTVYVPMAGESEVPAAALTTLRLWEDQSANLPGAEASAEDFEPGIWEQLLICREVKGD